MIPRGGQELADVRKGDVPTDPGGVHVTVDVTAGLCERPKVSLNSQ